MSPNSESDQVTSPSASFGPTTPQERIQTLDILRGFAIFCIFAVTWVVTTPWHSEPWMGFHGTADQAAYWLIKFFLDEKSWPQFAILFGLGFSIQMIRAEARGVPFVGRYLRRLLVLFLFGALHFSLAERDILHRLALFGILLLPLGKLSSKMVLTLFFAMAVGLGSLLAIDGILVKRREHRLSNEHVAIAVDQATLEARTGQYLLENDTTIFITKQGDSLFLQSGTEPRQLTADSPDEFVARPFNVRVSFSKDAAGAVSGIVLHQGGNDTPGKRVAPAPPIVDDHLLRQVANQSKADEILAHGSFLDVIKLRSGAFFDEMKLWTTRRGFMSQLWMFPPFLIGLYIGRRRIFEDIETNLPLFRKMMWWGFAIGLPITAYILVIKNFERDGGTVNVVLSGLSDLLAQINSPALGIAYISAITLFVQRDAGRRLLKPLAAVGRMALTNYLLGSVAFVFLFFGFGLGLYGTGPFGALVLATAWFGVEIVLSNLWMKRFRFGPVEWLWRAATYGELPPMRVRP